jgi:hypothetical protein
MWSDAKGRKGLKIALRILKQALNLLFQYRLKNAGN